MNIVSKFFVILLLIFSACKQEVTEGVYLVTSEEMEELLLMDEVQLIDVRTPGEYKDGYIQNAVNMNFFDSDFDEKINTLDKDKPTCVYCKKGGRSAKAAKMMKEKGFKKVYDLKGGITEWKGETRTLE